jgi:hypothetical protein
MGIAPACQEPQRSFQWSAYAQNAKEGIMGHFCEPALQSAFAKAMAQQPPLSCSFSSRLAEPKLTEHRLVDPRLITSNRFGQFYDAMRVLGKALENPPELTKIFKFEPCLNF